MRGFRRSGRTRISLRSSGLRLLRLLPLPDAVKRGEAKSFSRRRCARALHTEKAIRSPSAHPTLPPRKRPGKARGAERRQAQPSIVRAGEARKRALRRRQVYANLRKPSARRARLSALHCGSRQAFGPDSAPGQVFRDAVQAGVTRPFLSRCSESTSRTGRSTGGHDAQSRPGADCKSARRHRPRSAFRECPRKASLDERDGRLVTERGTAVKGKSRCCGDNVIQPPLEGEVDARSAAGGVTAPKGARNSGTAAHPTPPACARYASFGVSNRRHR